MPGAVIEAIQQHIYAYERLKAEMERLKNHEEEQFFFAKELRARRAREPRWLKRLPNYAYEILSDYGRSIARPTVWIFVLWLVGTALLMTPAANYYGLLTIDSAAALSATNLIPLLPRKPLNAEDDLTALDETGPMPSGSGGGEGRKVAPDENRPQPGGGTKTVTTDGGAIILTGHETVALPRSRGALQSLRRTNRGRHGLAASHLSPYPSRERPQCQRQKGTICSELHGPASGVPRRPRRIFQPAWVLSGQSQTEVETPIAAPPGTSG